MSFFDPPGIRDAPGTASYLDVLLNTAPDGVLIADAQGVILECNAEAEKLFGFRREELIGLRLEDTVIPTDLRVAHRHAIERRLREQGAPYGLRRRLISRGLRRDGSEFPVELHVSCLRAGEAALLVGFVRDLSEQENAKRRLSDERALMQNLVETLPGTFFVFDESGRMRRWNRRLEEITGYRSEEIAALTALDFIPPEDRTRIAARISDIFREGQASAESGLLCKDGTAIPFFFAGRRVGVDGENFVVGVGYDVSAQRVAERELRESEQRLRLVSRVTTDVIWDWDLATDKTWHNEGLAATFGYSKADKVDAWLEHIHPDDRPRVEASIREHIRSGKGFWEARYRLRRGDGSYAHVYDRGLLVHDVAGQPVRMVGAMVDVTEQTRAEERTRLVAKVMESVAEAIVILDAELHVLAVNPAYTAIFGRQPQDVIGRLWPFLNDPEVSENTRREVLATVRRTGNWRGELVARREDGHSIPVLLSLSAVPEGAGGIGNFVAVVSDLTSSRQYEQQVAFLARHHPLTGLPGRPLLWERLAAAVERAGARRHALALLEIDLDGFQLINDSLGQAVGDDLLRKFAAHLQRLSGRPESVFHPASDSFAMLLEVPSADAQAQAVAVAQTLVGSLDQPFASGKHELYLSASVGIALFPGHGTEAGALLRQANTALNRAKRHGPNAWELYAPQMDEFSAELLLLGTKLRRAIEQQELFLHYQPIVDLASGRIRGVEALLRWRQAELGLVTPSRFIPVAEQSGLIMPLGQWVLGEACRQMARWHAQGHRALQLAVNISARQLRQGDFAVQVGRILADSGLPAGALVLEITESVMMENPVQTRAIFEELHRLGVEIAVDDFGTGYSSLGYIRNYRVDHLKMDRSFVSSLPHDEDQGAIVRSILAMARSLGIRVIAEGVETPAQHAFLRRLKCAQGQGYWYARPQPAERLEELLRAGRPLLKGE